MSTRVAAARASSRSRRERLRARKRRRRLLAWCGFLVPALAALWWLRPVTLGGDTAYVIVAGNSMRPTYQPGDLVVTRAKSEYISGDIVLYRVPEGEPGEGLRVIHRIVDVRPDGSYVTQGDNRERADEWAPRASDVEGKPRYILRGVGVWLRAFVQPHVFASVMAFSIMWATWPQPRRRLAGGMEPFQPIDPIDPIDSFEAPIGPLDLLEAVEALVVWEPHERAGHAARDSRIARARRRRRRGGRRWSRVASI